MFKRFFTVAAFAMLFAACQVVEVEVESVPGQESGAVTIGAIYESIGSIGTKSEINPSSGAFTWSEGDAIRVNSSEGSWNELTLNSGAGNASATFYVKAFYGGDPCTPAVFPSRVFDHYAGATLYLNLPSVIEWNVATKGTTMQADNIMVARDWYQDPSYNMSLAFKNVGGLFRLSLRKIPAEARYLVFTTNQKISGQFAVGTVDDEEDETIKYPVINTTDTNVDAEKTVTIDFGSTLGSETDMVFYIPVPVGDYQISSLALKGENNTTLWEINSTATNRIERRHMKKMPTITVDVTTGGGGESGPNYVIITDPGQTGDVNMFNTTHDVIVQMNSTSGEINLVYPEGATQKPEKVYITILDGATVSRLNINLPNSTVYINGYQASNVGSLTSVTAASTLNVLASYLTIGTATVNQGNVDIKGTVNAVVVAAGATSDGQTAGESNKIQVSVSSQAAVQTITLNAATDVVVEQPQGNIEAENTENKVYVIVNAENSSATAQNGGDIYVTANANCSVTADGVDEKDSNNNSTVVVENNTGSDSGVTTKEEGEGTVNTDGEVKKAQIGEAQYKTVALAFAEAKDGDTVTLIADNYISETLVNAKNITLDLGTYSIVGNVNGKLLTNQGTLTINADSSNPGKIYNTEISAQGHDAVFNDEGATITINGGIFGDSDADMANANNINRGAGLRNFGTATLNGGYFTACDNFTNGGYAYAVINGNDTNNPTLTINAGVTVYGQNHGNIAGNSGTINISGGTFNVFGSRSYYCVYSYNAIINVANGTFTKSNGGDAKYIFCVEVDKDNASNPGKIYVTGGTFAQNNANTTLASSSAYIALSGGSFNVDPSAYCAGGYAATQSGSTWTVGPVADPVAIGSQGYATLDAAVADAADGDTVTILAADSYTIPAITKNLTIEASVSGVVVEHTTDAEIASIASGKTATFKNITFELGTSVQNAIYHGFGTSASSGALVMNGCTINGALHLFGVSSFTNCTFTASGIYNIWAIDSDASFTGCSFTNTNRAVNVYDRLHGSTVKNVSFSNCTFTASEKRKAAINIHQYPDRTYTSAKFAVSINNCTTSGTWASTVAECTGEKEAETICYSPLWMVSDIKDWVVGDITVSVNGVAQTLFAASIDTTYYKTLVDAFAEATDGQTITLLADLDFSQAPYADYKWSGSTYNPLKLCVNNVTIDLGGHTISNMGNSAIAIGHLLAKDGRVSNLTVKNGTLRAGKTDNVTNSYVLLIAGVDGMTVKNVTTNGGINVCSGSANVVIEDCTINGTKYYTVCSQTGSEVTIKGTNYTKNTDATVAEKSMFWIQGAGTDSDMKTDSNTTGAFGASSITIENGSYTVDFTNGGVFYLTSGVAPSLKGGTYNFDPSAYIAAGYGVTRSGSNYVVAQVNTIWDGSSKAALTDLGNNTYGIYSAAQMAQFADDVNNSINYSGKTVKLMNNIDLNDQPWTPIGNVTSQRSPIGNGFLGTFDGNGKTISNLSVTALNGEYSYAGFFGSINPQGQTVTIQNLTIDDFTISSNHFAGAILGETGHDSVTGKVAIKNCYVSNGDITTTPWDKGNGVYDDGNQAGGLIGSAYNYTYEITGNTVDSVNIKGYRALGGIAGFMTSATFTGNTVKDCIITQSNVNSYSIASSWKLDTIDEFVGQRGSTEDNYKTAWSIDESNTATNVEKKTEIEVEGPPPASGFPTTDPPIPGF